MKTVVSVAEDKFLFNGKLTYSELANCPEQHKGLLMNARFIQGVFDETMDVSRFDRYGKKFDPETNTDELIENLPTWYNVGLRAITVGFQGGGPCFTINNQTMKNSPYSEDGKAIDEAYLARMKRIIDAADEIGMAVIVSLFYGEQTRHLKDDETVVNAVKTASNWLRDNKFTNVIVEIANEHDLRCFAIHPILHQDSGIVTLMELARRETGGMLIGCSGAGGYYSDEVAYASDVILLHGNSLSRQYFYNILKKARAVTPKRPVVCNEDSQAISQLEVTFKTGCSWGYYNNMTKQEPPIYWGITEGEDTFYAKRLCEYLGIESEEIAFEDQFYLQGLEPHMTYEGKRWIRLASLYPEKINYVEFYRDGEYVDSAYDDPFMIHYKQNWLQDAVEGIQPGEVWKAVVYVSDGRVVEKTVTVE